MLGDQRLTHSAFASKKQEWWLDTQIITEHPIYSIHGIPKRMKLNEPVKRKSYRAKKWFERINPKSEIDTKIFENNPPKSYSIRINYLWSIPNHKHESTRIQFAKSKNIPYLKPIDQYWSTKNDFLHSLAWSINFTFLKETNHMNHNDSSSNSKYYLPCITMLSVSKTNPC